MDLDKWFFPLEIDVVNREWQKDGDVVSKLIDFKGIQR